MNKHDTAVAIADQIFDSIVEVAWMAIQLRRKQACWWRVYYAKRLAMAHPIGRPWWRLKLKRATAQCAANRHCGVIEDKLAKIWGPSTRVVLVLLALLGGCVVEDMPAECENVWPDCEGIGNACIDGACVSVSLECNASEECQPGYVCGDTRACSLPCDSRAGCQGGLVCRPELGYCSDPCDSDDDCDLAPGAVCDLDIGVCWYEPGGS
ncbi:MAG TPA: hypothetical protein VJP45_10470 [Candidatus Limnocylindria bacterium]|nr:hypothetical protein [Candidatus Limnocylindria bacterium]